MGPFAPRLAALILYSMLPLLRNTVTGLRSIDPTLLEAALGAFERMLRLSWVGASKAKAAVAFNKMGRVWRRKGDLKLSLEYLERGAELF